MRLIKKDQNGFGTLELILVLIIVLLIGVVGYMVYKNHNTPAKVVTVTKTVKVPAKSSSTSNASIYKVPNLGIQIINIPTSLKGLTSAEISADPSNVSEFFSTVGLAGLDSACSASSGAVGALTKNSGTYNPNDIAPTTFVKQFTGFWISYNHPQAACSSVDSTNTLETSLASEFQTLVTNKDNIELLQ